MHLMRVLSRFKDYYDGAGATDFERTPLYVRDTVRLDLGGMTAHARGAIRRGLGCWGREGLWPPRLGTFATGMIGFCGRHVPFYQIDGEACFDVDDVVRALQTTSGGLERHERDARLALAVAIETGDGHRRWWRQSLTRRGWQQWLEARPAVDDGPFRHFQVPCFVWWDTDVLELNPRLASLSFARVVHPWEAWQAISTFLANNLVVPDTPRSPQTDREKAEAHGFDGRSFRRTPGRQKASRVTWEDPDTT